MSFSYIPFSEEEVQRERKTLVEDGAYPFKVNRVISKMSRPKPGKESNPMLELHLTLWDEKGKEIYVYDYLPNTKNMAWKHRHFCASIGLIREYEAGKFEPWLAEGKHGIANIKQQAGQPKEGGGSYPDKNVVEDYVVTEKGAHKFTQNYSTEGTFNSNKTNDSFGSDDIPF